MNTSRSSNRKRDEARHAGKTNRRLGRARIGVVVGCGIAAVLAGYAVLHTVAPWNGAANGVALAAPEPSNNDRQREGIEDTDGGPGGPLPPPPTPIPLAQPGAPRPWESAMHISTYSTVNMLNRNVYTVIPIVSWTGIGPPMTMNLYHNSASVNEDFDITRGMGFDLGPGWTTSFSAHLFDDSLGNRVVVADDGTRDLFTQNGSQWDGPPGVHDVLTFDGVTYRLTHKDQSFDEFDADGLLTAVVDAVGNRITIQRANGRIDTVTDASGRLLQFVYLGANLDKIIDPKEDDPTNTLVTLQQREWTFAYDADGRVFAVTDPMAFLNDFQYDAAGHISQIRDKYDPNDLNTPVPGWYVYLYDAIATQDKDRIRSVTDPLNLARFFRVFSDGNFRFHVRFTDRRGNNWVYDSWQGVPTALIEDAPVGAITNPLGEKFTFVYDNDRNLIRATDALGNTWTFTYDDRGNTLTAASPLHDPGIFNHRQVWTYDDYPPGSPLEGQLFNNLTSYTDAAGNVTTYNYTEADFPTLLTSIVEPEAVSGGGTAITRFEYFIAPYSTPTCNPTGIPGSNECKHGQLEKITDPNTVVTSFDYGQWGQTHFYREGQVGGVPVYEMRTEIDSGSRTYVVETGAGEARCGGSTGRIRHNQNSHSTGGFCVAQTPGCSSRAGTVPTPFCTPDFAELLTSADWNATIDPMGRTAQQEIDLTFESDFFAPVFLRSFDSNYDALGTLVNSVLDTQEHDGPPRQFDYPYDLSTGIFTRVGPDLVETVTTLDEANRVESVVRELPPGAGGGLLMVANYDYHANGLLHFVSFLNGTVIEYTYDAASRVTVIEHRDNTDLSLLKLTYGYNNRDLPTSIVEETAGVETAQTLFTYDNRGRLTGEIRSVSIGTGAYNLLYEYDQGGNRTLKVDVLNTRRNVYTYDIQDPATYLSDNNRLMFVETFNTGGSQELISTRYYTYNAVGNVLRVITERVSPGLGERKFTTDRFLYAGNGETVSYVMGEAWDETPPFTCAANYEITYGREFRYDGARARYLVRELDTAQLELENVVALSETWSDYDGVSIYADFTINGTTVTQTAIYEPGIGRSFAPDNALATQYYHADALGTTRLLTDTQSFGVPPNVVSESSYTAFGEQVGGNSQRYGYAGSWGYQTDESSDGFPFQHVGFRYYDPATGRFLQRDPIGIRGGSNVYGYVGNAPTIWVDPEGLNPFVHRCTKHKECRDWNKRFKKKPETTEEELRRVKRRIKIIKVAIACALGYLTGGVGAGYTGALVGGGAGAVGGTVSVLE